MTEMNTENNLEAMQRAHGPLLEVKNLQVDFTTDEGKAVHAVRNSSFSVYPGQWVAIVGESGSGKSTSAMAVLGLLPGTGHVVGGSIKLDGQEISGFKQKDFDKLRGSKMGLVPQDPMSNLNPVWRIGTQVKEALVANNMDIDHEKRSEFAKALAGDEVELKGNDDETFLGSKELPDLIAAAKEALVKIGKSGDELDKIMARFAEEWVPGSETRWRVADGLIEAGVKDDDAWYIAKKYVVGSTMDDRIAGLLSEAGLPDAATRARQFPHEFSGVATQKSILTDYVKKQGWHLAKTYVDDGYSGTNFQRPSFQNMIKDIESGLINCVITKDLSRLGRNYLDCGLYLEVFFPEHNVRYIAVNDGVDTLNKSAMDITPFRNILNEMYSADVSVKIKSAYRARFQQGKFMGTTAPYGYVKDPADHNHLLIDDKVAHVVREIFDLALAGNGIAKIRKHINKQHILRPAAYAAEQGATGYERYFEENEENRYIWSENSVRGILRSPIYAGNLAGYKRIAANMKSKKRPSKLPEEWEVIPDTHEGIVTQEEFDTVQQLITSRRLPENKGGFENIFAGVIKCADCGYAMRAMSANRRKRPDIIDCVQYSCNNYGRYGNIMCTAHSIEARDLFNAVLTDINRFADMAVNDEKAVRAIEKRLTETDQSKAKALEKEQRKLNKRLAELDRLFSSLYEDKVMERITERNFEMMSGKYQKEQLEIEARLKEVTETLSDSYEKTQGVRDFLSLIRNYQGIKELDATIINALIDKILVSEREKLTDGMVRQEIKIYYKFIGFVGELHITPTKRWTALKPKNCTVCGVEYVPRSGISKYCPACAKKIQREKSNESKRRSRERNRQACIELSAKNDRLTLNSRREESYDRATRMIRSRYFVMLRKVHLTVIRGSSSRISRNLSDRS